MSNSYLIKLKPLAPFFFGGEKSAELGNKTDFFQRTQCYPQQTALLGMLRYELLLIHNLLGFDPQNAKKVIELIGKKSFEISDEEQNFKQIKGLSPIFLMKGDDFVHTCPLDSGYVAVSVPTKMSFNQKDSRSSAVFLSNYSAKDGLSERLISSNGEIFPLKYDKKQAPNGIFRFVEQAGNQKKGVEEAFYRQEYGLLPDGFCFAFFATFQDKLPESYSNTISLGGQQSPFLMQTKIENSNIGALELYQSTLPKDEFHRLVLLSDAFIEEEVLENSIFMVNEIVVFRNMQTSVRKTTKYNNLTRGENKEEEPSMSEQYQLLAKGSVLYFDDVEKLKNVVSALEHQTNFRTIGYNYYKIYLSNPDTNGK